MSGVEINSGASRSGVFRALKKYSLATGVIIALLIGSIFVGSYILLKQRVSLPWTESYNLNVQMRSTQSVTPGQGQQVLVSGVQVGQVEDVHLKDGKAIAVIRLDRNELPEVYKNATAALRARTGLQDMTLSLDPGTRRAGKIEEGGTIFADRTMSQSQLDEALSALDGDTRQFVRHFLKATSQTFNGSADQIKKMLELGTPTARKAQQLTAQIRTRNKELRKTVDNLTVISKAAARYDGALAGVIEEGAANLKTLRNRDAEVRSTLARMPQAVELAGQALEASGGMANELAGTAKVAGPAVNAAIDLMPKADHLSDSIVNDFPDFAKLVTPASKLTASLRRTSNWVVPSLPTLNKTMDTFTELGNLLGYNPPGPNEGYSRYLPWLGHNVNSMTSVEDVYGSQWRSSVMLDCTSLSAMRVTKPISDIFDAYHVCE